MPNVRKTWAPVGQTPILRHSYRRDKRSVISCLTVSPRRRRIGLYFRCHPTNIDGERVVAFVRQLLRHLRGKVVLLWDGGLPHRSVFTRQALRRCHRLSLHRFPAYAPELNPDEHIWTQTKQALANSTHEDAGALQGHLSQTLRRLQRTPRLLWSCFGASDLPWP